jgi:hypothetical protein
LSKSDLQVELLFLARSAIWYARHQVEALPELRHRFDQRPPRDRLLTGLEQVASRFVYKTSIRAMSRQQLRLALRNFWKLPF